MDKFTQISGIAAPMPLVNIDTDMIIPKQFLKTIKRSGLGKNLFDEMRFDRDGKENPDFVLNKPQYRQAQILVAGDNFGCGSSREHAPWAIEDYGFNTVISTSFADIFYSNCFKNGIIPIKVTTAELDALMAEISANEGVEFTVDLEAEKLTTPGGIVIKIEVDPFRKQSLLEGLDDIAWSLKHEDKITAFEEKHKQQLPWLWK